MACLEAGPLGPADADAAERSLRDAHLVAGSWLVQKTEDRGAFMVYMGRYADRDTLQGKLDQLKRRKVEAEDVRSLPELQPGLNLGRFDNKPATDAALARFLQRGVHTARVITLRPAQTQTVLRLPAADAALRGRLAGGLAFGGCAGAGAPSAAASATSAASAASAPSAASSASASR